MCGGSVFPWLGCATLSHLVRQGKPLPTVLGEIINARQKSGSHVYCLELTGDTKDQMMLTGEGSGTVATSKNMNLTWVADVG